MTDGEAAAAAGVARAQPARAMPPPGPAGWEDAVRRLHGALLADGYREIARLPTVKNPLALVLEPQNLWTFFAATERRLLLQASVAPALYRALERRRHPARERQFALFFLGERLPADEVQRLLAALPGAPPLDPLLAEGVLAADVTGVRSNLRFIPAGRLLMVTDPYDRAIPDFTWLGRDSLVFAERLAAALADRRFGRVLDLCCGTGVQGLTVAASAERVDGTDVNARAVAFANLNAALAGLGARAAFSVGNLAEGLAGPYDLVVANPPYVWLPREQAAVNRDGYGGELGLEVVTRILGDLDRLLADHGEAHIICDSPVIAGAPALTGIVRRVLGQTRLGVVLTPLRYMVYRQFARFHRARGSSHGIYFHVRVGRDLAPGLVEEQLPPLRRVLNRAFVAVASPLYARLAPAKPARPS